MRNLYLPVVLLSLLLLLAATNSFGCSCRPPDLSYFWDVVSPTTKNAMVRFEQLVDAESNEQESVGRFRVLENYNIPDVKVNETIIIKSGTTTCDKDIRRINTGDTLIVALYDNYRLYGGCTFNYLDIRDGHGEGQSLEEIKARILTITNSAKVLAAQNNILLYPNPATASLTVEVPLTGWRAYKIELLDISGRIVKTMDTTKASENLDVQGLPTGLYFLKLSCHGQNPILRKWVKA